jgi:hypothetical protein
MRANPTQGILGLQQLEGRRVNLSLTDGSQLRGVEIISAGRGRLSSLWLELDGTDPFIEKSDVVGIDDVLVDRAA